MVRGAHAEHLLLLQAEEKHSGEKKRRHIIQQALSFPFTVD
jgi:hypothetical protein